MNKLPLIRSVFKNRSSANDDMEHLKSKSLEKEPEQPYDGDSNEESSISFGARSKSHGRTIFKGGIASRLSKELPVVVKGH
jgi:hypothetical protein